MNGKQTNKRFMREYSKRKNLSRGYIKLEVWHLAIDLYIVVVQLCHEFKIDFKIRSQISDAAQSVSANIAEGYSRRSINEYLQHLYVSLGSLSETLSRVLALLAAEQIAEKRFDEFDALHYEVENKLWNLVASLEEKRDEGTWIDRIPQPKGSQ